MAESTVPQTNTKSEIDTGRFAINEASEAFKNPDKLIPTFVKPSFVGSLAGQCGVTLVEQLSAGNAGGRRDRPGRPERWLLVRGRLNHWQSRAAN